MTVSNAKINWCSFCATLDACLRITRRSYLPTECQHLYIYSNCVINHFKILMPSQKYSSEFISDYICMPYFIFVFQTKHFSFTEWRIPLFYWEKRQISGAIHWCDLSCFLKSIIYPPSFTSALISFNPGLGPI